MPKLLRCDNCETIKLENQMIIIIATHPKGKLCDQYRYQLINKLYISQFRKLTIKLEYLNTFYLKL